MNLKHLSCNFLWKETIKKENENIFSSNISSGKASFPNQGITYKEKAERSLQFINQEIAEKKLGQV